MKKYLLAPTIALSVGAVGIIFTNKQNISANVKHILEETEITKNVINAVKIRTAMLTHIDEMVDYESTRYLDDCLQTFPQCNNQLEVSASSEPGHDLDNSCTDAKAVLESGKNFESFFKNVEGPFTFYGVENDLINYQGYSSVSCIQESVHDNLEIILNDDNSISFVVLKPHDTKK